MRASARAVGSVPAIDVQGHTFAPIVAPGFAVITQNCSKPWAI
jgi:N-acetyl-beta-hexosaminidase